jgi:hypothetical protein
MAEALGWRWEFGVQIPPLLLCLLVSQLSIPSDLGLEKPLVRGAGGGVDYGASLRSAFDGFDFLGATMLAVCIVFFILGLNLGGNVLPCEPTLSDMLDSLTRHQGRIPSSSHRWASLSPVSRPSYTSSRAPQSQLCLSAWSVPLRAPISLSPT